MAITVGRLPASSPGSTSYTTSGNSITLTYNPSGQPAGTNYKVDYWKIETAGYEMLEYLQSDGKAYINLNDHPFNDASYTLAKSCKIYADFSLLAAPTALTYLWGSQSNQTAARNSMWCAVNKTTGKLKNIFGNAKDPEAGAYDKVPGMPADVFYNISPNTKYHLEQYAFGLEGYNWEIVNLNRSLERFEYTGLADIQQTPNNICFTKFFPLYIFSFNKAGTSNSGTAMRLYKFKVELSPSSDGKNKTIDLVPAKRLSDGVLGLYDTVTNNFYTNAGSGSFSAGPTTGTKVLSKIYGNNTITIQYDPSRDFKATACVYDTSRYTHYVEYEASTLVETSKQCLLLQTLFTSPNNKLDLSKQWYLGSTVNGGVSLEGNSHVFFAQADGYIQLLTKYMTPGTKSFIIVNDKIKLIYTYSTTSTEKGHISDYFGFKKGDLILFGGAANYTAGLNGAVVWYV